MSRDSSSSPRRKWHDSAHASLCLLGSYPWLTGFLLSLEEAVEIQQSQLRADRDHLKP